MTTDDYVTTNHGQANVAFSVPYWLITMLYQGLKSEFSISIQWDTDNMKSGIHPGNLVSHIWIIDNSSIVSS